MIPALETEWMWARSVRLEDAEQVQKIFPQWEIVKHLGAVVPWPYPPDGAHRRVELLVVDAHDVNPPTPTLGSTYSWSGPDT